MLGGHYHGPKHRTVGVRTIPLRTPYNKALASIREVARAHGFQITEARNLGDFVRHSTGNPFHQRTTALQMEKPELILESTFIGSPLPLILPLRMILQEVGIGASVLSVPEWEVVKDSEAGDADHCMELLYRETVAKIAQAIQLSV